MSKIDNSQPTRKIRKVSLPKDGERLLEVFAAAKGIMVADGNATSGLTAIRRWRLYRLT